MPLPVIDTRPYFRPLCADIVTLFRSLSEADWGRPTVAGSWRVRDVAAHLVDTALRRLSMHRDGLIPDGKPPANERELAALINELNATWVHTASRLSPRVLTDLYEAASTSLADFMESLDLEAAARWPVSWAGQTESRQWLDVGREFTEIWHHGAQIRDAVQAGPFREARWLRAVLDIAMHALPPAYRRERNLNGGSLALNVTGSSGGGWILESVDDNWRINEISRGEGRESGSEPTTRITMTDETAWRLLFNALPPRDLHSLVHVEGDAALAAPLLRTRAIVI
jgi:uncharacterized protein (TIGR03083 family)